MNKKTTRGLSQDRSKVAGGQNYEVDYEKNKLNVSGETIKKEIKKEDNSRKKIEEKINRRH
ncbi:MAG TPA: DUF3606 domain-containing protein [Hanamia sp.]